jgi:hypothetical protein
MSSAQVWGCLFLNLRLFPSLSGVAPLKHTSSQESCIIHIYIYMLGCSYEVIYLLIQNLLYMDGGAIHNDMACSLLERTKVTLTMRKLLTTLSR